MRFERVTADAFGPFFGKALHFAPGLTVVWGPNESGKSSWHAALYAGLCGMRRGRGAAKAEDREFADRHRPWDGRGWRVSAVVVLDDGRRIELSHDLDGRVDCRAVDADTGRDVSDEIMEEGAPDGSRWLGFNRRTFLAIGCVRQAALLAVLNEPQSLQEHLQRAADTAGTDATAAAALERLEAFRKLNVGQDRSNSPRPLRKAIDRARAATEAVDEARAEHAAFVQLVRHADELEALAATLRERLRRLRAARAAREAAHAQERLARARELSACFPDGPPALPRDDALAQQVSAAVALWNQRPAVPELNGPSAAALHAQLAALPAPPDGDLTVHADVRAARAAFQRAQQATELHAAKYPSVPERSVDTAVSADELRALAADLEAPVPVIDPVSHERFERARQRAEAVPSKRTQAAALVLGTMSIVVAAVAAGLGHSLFALVWLIAGVGVILWAALRGSGVARLRAVEELRAAENALGAQRHAMTAAQARHRRALASVSERNLPVDPPALRALAEELLEFERGVQALAAWAATRDELSGQLAATTAQLAAALVTRGATVGASVEDAFAAYEMECGKRADIAARAARRSEIELQVANREAAERAAAEARQKQALAQSRLRAAAQQCGVSGEDETALVRGLLDWQQRRAARERDDETRRAQWYELEALLEHGTLAQLADRASQRTREAERLAEGIDHGEIAALAAYGVDLQEMTRLEHQSEETARTASQAKGNCEARTRTLRSVCEAEESLAAAEQELARVRRLDETLELTRQFLERAETRVHRDVARVLAETIRPWLPTVTAGRYADVRVDPGTLAVRVRDCSGEWRNAAFLSHGTAEQIYLLLRVALAKHLARSEETCALILDDVTAQCDSSRTTAVLNLLHAISKERQVIVFSQEDEVLAWAQAHLGAPQDRLERLDGGHTESGA